MSANVIQDGTLRSMLRCPVTCSTLTVASDSVIALANQLSAVGKLVDRIGQAVSGSFEAGLINADQSLLIPVRGGIVIMLADSLIPMTQLTNQPTPSQNT